MATYRDIMRNLGLFIFLPFLLFAQSEQAVNTISNLRNPDYLNRNFAQPLTGGSEFRTFDGSRTFRANLECPSSERAVVISFIPAGYGEWNISIAADMDLDGHYDRRFSTTQLGIRVSGVCTNGIVYCSPPNVWDLNHCRYYKWTVRNGFITLQRTENRDEVGACICTNYACGQNNFPPYRYVVGAVSRVLMNANPQFLIGRGEWDLTTFRYYLYGQDRERCTALGGRARDFNGRPLTDYASAHIYPSVDLVDVELTQGSDPYSPYNTAIAASHVEFEGNRIGVPNIYSCWIKKDISVSSRIHYESCSNRISYNGRIWCIASAFSKGGGGCCRDCGEFRQEANYRFKLKKDQEYAVLFTVCCLCGDRGRYWYAYVNGQRIGSWGSYCNCCGGPPCGIFRILGRSPRTNFEVSISAQQKAFAWGKHHSYPPKGGTIYFLKGISYLGDDFRFVEQNNCHPDSDCRIKNEWICPPDVNLPSRPSLGQLRRYCIQTVNDGTILHPALQPMCKTVSTQVDTYRICMNGSEVTVINSRGETVYRRSGNYMWFKIYREYTCGIRQFNIDLTRENQTRDSANYQNGRVSYTDYVGGTGRQTITINLGNPNECPQPSCLVRVSINEADVFSDSSNREQATGTSQRYRYEIRECRRNSAGAWYCPTDGGATILESCSCQRNFSGFNIAVTTLQAVDEASHDIICSQE